jgi:hypothetical protein
MNGSTFSSPIPKKYLCTCQTAWPHVFSHHIVRIAKIDGYARVGFRVVGVDGKLRRIDQETLRESIESGVAE